MRKGKIVAVCAIIILLFACGLLLYSDAYQYVIFSDDAKDKLVWETVILPELGGKTVETIKVTDWDWEWKEVDSDLHEFIMDELTNAVFYESNRKGFGPTPEMGLTLTFTDNTRLTLSLWPDGETFETASIREFTSQDHRFIDKSQILIKSGILTAWLEDYVAYSSNTKEAYSLTIKSNVPLSRAFLEETYIGSVPADLTLLPGSYTITIVPPESSGHEPIMQEIDVGPAVKNDIYINFAERDEKPVPELPAESPAEQPAVQQPPKDREIIDETIEDQDDHFTFHSAVSQSIGIDLLISEERYRVEVRGEHKLSVLKQQLGKAKLVDEPVNVPEGQHYRLVLMFPGGEKVEYVYHFNDIKPEEPAYVEFDGNWYEVPGTVINLFLSIGEYPDASTDIDAVDEALLKEYGWTPFFLINTFEISLPEKFEHTPGTFPTVLYWAYNNELSKAIELDLSPYLGEDVDVRLYKIAELLPEFIHGPRRGSGRAVIVHYGEEVVGAWLDMGRHYAFACSLNGRTMEAVTQKQWEEWIPGVINPEDPVEQRLAELTPEEIIHEYYAALDRGDHAAAYACLSRRNLSSYLFSNMDNDLLYNQSYEDNFLGSSGLSNITAAEVLKIERWEDLEEMHYPPGTQVYEVNVNLEVKIPVTYESGPQTRFISLSKETPATGWRIDAIGTGP